MLTNMARDKYGDLKNGRKGVGANMVLPFSPNDLIYTGTLFFKPPPGTLGGGGIFQISVYLYF